MTMQTDVKAKNLTSTAASAIGVPRARVRAGAAELIKIDTPASATHTGYLLFPGEGVLFRADPYVTITNATSVTFFYG